MKTCTKCGEEKVIGEFSNSSHAQDGFRNQCKSCVAKYNKEYRNRPENKAKLIEYRKTHKEYFREYFKNHRENHREHVRNYRKNHSEYFKSYNLMKNYGITLEQKQQMIKDQDSKCAICGDGLDGGRHTHVDHNHETGQIRGILCKSCNTGLGWVERPGFIKGATEYLIKYRLLQGVE